MSFGAGTGRVNTGGERGLQQCLAAGDRDDMVLTVKGQPESRPGRVVLSLHDQRAHGLGLLQVNSPASLPARTQEHAHFADA